MTGRSRLKWVLGALLGILVAICAGFVALPTMMPTPPATEIVVMQGYEAQDVERYRPRPGPPPVEQPVPTVEEVPTAHAAHWERAHDRADWIGGATVTCDLSELPSMKGVLGDDEGPRDMAFINMDQGVDLRGAVDVTSRVFSPIEAGRLTFTVREPAGTARALVPTHIGRTGDDSRDVNTMRSSAIRIRWSGAVPGSTVGCDGVWDEEEGVLRIDLTDVPPPPRSPEGLPMSGPGYSMPPVLRGCGVMIPTPGSSFDLEVAAGRCVLQLEARNPSFPLIVNRGPAVAVDVRPGQTTTLRMRHPPVPPLYQTPDLTEVQTAADIASYFGYDVAADALDEVVEKLASGEWDADKLSELLQGFTNEVDEEVVEGDTGVE